MRWNNNKKIPDFSLIMINGGENFIVYAQFRTI